LGWLCHAPPVSITPMAMIPRVAAQRLTVPESVEELARRAGWSVEKALAAGAGHTRHRAPAGVSQVDLACDAVSRLGLGSAELRSARWLIGAQAVPWRAMPTNAASVHARFSLPPSVQCSDINASCLSFLAALQLVGPGVDASGCPALVASAEDPLIGLDWSEPHSAALFGAGAAAAWIVPDRSPEKGETLLAIKTQLIESYTESSEACVVRGGGTKDPFGAVGYGKFSMNGRSLFQAASRNMEGFIERFVSQGGVDPSVADWVVPHQASREAIELMRRRLNISPERLVVRFEEFGNQVAASMPEGLASLYHSGRLRHGDRILLLGTGAGLLIGATELTVVADKP